MWGVLSVLSVLSVKCGVWSVLVCGVWSVLSVECT